MRSAMLWTLVFGLVVGGAVVGSLPVGAGEEPAPEPEPEAETVPDFTLTDVEGKEHKLQDFRGKWVVLEWTNFDCPFVKKHYHTERKNMQTLQAKYREKGVIWLTICSSAPGKQGHMTAEDGKRRFKEEGSKATALLLDPEGKVGRDYEAKTTPDMRIIDPKGVLVYRGAIDDTRSASPDDIDTSENYVAKVLDAVLAGEETPVSETRPYGCSVKYAR